MAMSTFISDYKDNGPETLLRLCVKFIVQNINAICSADPITKDLKLNEGILLPTELCEKLLDSQQEGVNVVDDRFAKIFEDRHCTRLRRVKLRNANLTDNGLKSLLNHKLTELEIVHCPQLTEASLSCLNDNSDQLLSLVIGSSTRILPLSLLHSEPKGIEDGFSTYLKRGYIFKAPKLRRLAVRSLRVPNERPYFSVLLRPLHNLTHLDLSACYNLGDLSYLLELKCLLSLTLYNVERLQYVIQSISKLTSLRHLDISQSSDKTGLYQYENQTLASLVESLPHLVSLDISGTNLAGTGVAEHNPGSSGGTIGTDPKTDIPGLYSRISNPFAFLGLYGTKHGACRRHDIPAKVIAGDANEEQILVAASVYIDRPEILQKVLNELYHLFRYETCRNLNQALGTVLEAMDRHINEKHIQISASATLFYIVKGRDSKEKFVPKMKRRIISSLLNGMAVHKTDDTMLRNGCLTLCQFKIPEDVLFDYERLVHILLYMVSELEQEGFVQRIGIYLLNSLACQVDGFQKQLLGDLGTIERMLGLIEDRLERKVCDDVLEVSWSTMWNVTDETAVNCERFLDGKGMEYFLGCLRTFPDNEELLRNMMGLLGNVAEVQALRPRLMTSQFVSVFADLLDSCSDGIEVSYNAAGVLAHMASDGPEAWTLSFPRRKTVLARMVAAIERWDLGTERNINYRSFEPILNLARVYHTPACQHWAMWALANLTKVYPVKYCSLVEAEGGLAVLNEVLQHNLPYSTIKNLATVVITNCMHYRLQQSTDLVSLPMILALDG